MKYTGYQAYIFKTLYKMIENYNGMFVKCYGGQHIVFKFNTTDDKYDCFDTLVNMNFMNVVLKNLHGLHLQVTM